MKQTNSQQYKAFEMRLHEIQITSKEPIKRIDVLSEMVYSDYISLIKSTSSKMPGIFGYISVSYYYDTLAHMYGITPKYVARIINNTIKKCKKQKYEQNN